MHRRQSETSSPRKILVGLLTLSMILFLLPLRWTNRLISLVQLLVPVQDAATVAGDSTVRALSGGGSNAVSPEVFAATRRQQAALEHQTAALSARVEELENEVKVLTAARLWNVGGRRIGSQGRLIPARAVTGDVLPWRSSRLVTAGSLQGVSPDAAVVSNEFTVDQGEPARLRGGLAILLGEAFVGVVEQVGTHTSRVKLLSDPSVQMKVRIGRFEDEAFTLADGYFWLVGRGGGRMEIRDVEARSIESGAVRVGDVVLSDSTNANLPAAMTIGKVARIAPDRDNPLFAHLAVESAVAKRDLNRVYVYDPQSEQSP
ncbi:MAG: rod shape-determining protein MreC [Phycisphaerales bacterium]|nr:rod shape-determining protein MreC [Phycisphaerales bacterium]